MEKRVFTGSPGIRLAVLFLAVLVAFTASVSPLYAHDAPAPSSTTQSRQPIDTEQNALAAAVPAPPAIPGSDKFGNVLMAAGLVAIPFDEKMRQALPCIEPGSECDRLTQTISNLGGLQFMTAFVGGMYLSGGKNRETAKMAASALLNTAVITFGLKLVSGRARPVVEEDAGEFTGPKIRAKYDSFPSGHSASAFAVATVLARQDSERSWLYYTIATAVGLSRVRKNAHYPSDVLFGAGLGIRAGHSAVQELGSISIRF